MIGQRKNRKDFQSGLCLLILGLLLTYQSTKLSVWSRIGPDEGFFPLLLGILIMGLSLLVIVQSLFSARAQEKEKTLEEQKREVSLFRLASYAIPMLLYALLIEWVGFLITSGLFLIIIFKYVERQSWKITSLVGLFSIIGSYLIFVVWFKVPLPKGLIKWW